VEEEKGGWLNILPENKKKDIAIPKYLKLLLYKVDSKREYFTILEGVLRGSKGSVELKNGASHLSSHNSHAQAVQMTYSISKKVLTFRGKTYRAVDYENVRWKKGFMISKFPTILMKEDYIIQDRTMQQCGSESATPEIDTFIREQDLRAVLHW